MQSQLRVGERVVDLHGIKCPVLNIAGEHDDVVHPQASLPVTDVVGSRKTQTILFPAGHIGVVVGGGAQKKLWPQVGDWLKQHERGRRRTSGSVLKTVTLHDEGVIH